MGAHLDDYDIAVIGAGHAGVEAALAAARLGMRTVIFCVSLDTIANLACNPSIGGTAKGHLVREIDALGGEMGKAADETFLQSRMLNLGKGPAVHSLRVQADRAAYHRRMKQSLEQQPNLFIRQAEITDVLLDEEGGVCAVVTSLGAVFGARAVILATGTYLSGRIHIGDVSYESGPDNVRPAGELSAKLQAHGVAMKRFKTGTPARVHRRSIDFSQLERQDGDTPVTPLSFETEGELVNRASCYIAYTNAETHRIIRENLHRSPMYSGRIEGVGPRYCPSIEDKVVRFADKERHQLFIEPMGLDTEECYLQGMSSSLPEDVQLAFLRTIAGLEKVEIMRSAYAIEYDCGDPTGLLPTLENKLIPRLYGAGQFNGSSGYEEAAAQGLVAGINAARKLREETPIVLDRASSYIGTLIDDLVTKGVNDPYRMMTSRSEYRLLLRQDNADDRLTRLGYSIGLISPARFARFEKKWAQIDEETKRVRRASIAPTEALNAMLTAQDTSPLATGAKLAELLRRPQLSYELLAPFDGERPPLPHDVTEQVEIRIKYEGYIAKQEAQVEQMRRLERKLLPPDLDYREVRGLRLEAAEKLNRFRPLSIGQASRISGCSPADISVLLIWLTQHHAFTT